MFFAFGRLGAIKSETGALNIWLENSFERSYDRDDFAKTKIFLCRPYPEGP